MRSRMLLAVAAVAVAAVTLAGCRSNVGNAATVDGQRISESTVSDYITADAKPVQAQGANMQPFEVAPKTIVLQLLIETKLITKLLDAVPGRSLTNSQLAAARRSVLRGKSPKAFAAANQLTGYSDSFSEIFVRDRTLSAVLGTLAQQGVNVQALLAKVDFPVYVSPRYGTWNPKTFSLLSGNSRAGLPDYLSFSSAKTQVSS